MLQTMYKDTPAGVTILLLQSFLTFCFTKVLFVQNGFLPISLVVDFFIQIFLRALRNLKQMSNIVCIDNRMDSVILICPDKNDSAEICVLKRAGKESLRSNEHFHNINTCKQQ